MEIADNVRQVEKMALVGRLAASVAHESRWVTRLVPRAATMVATATTMSTPVRVHVNFGLASPYARLLLSTTTVCPSASCNFFAAARAMMSVA